jgi:hypothetical protein
MGMTDREIADMICLSLGYKLFAGPLDKSKVASAKAGVRKKSPSNREARAAWELYLRTPAPPPPSPTPLAEPWREDAVFTTALGNFGEQRHDAWNTGFRRVYVNLLHAAEYDNNVNHLVLFRNENWGITGWGTYGQGTDPYQDGLAAGSLCKQFGLDSWKANGEAWAEGPYAWKTSEFLRGWRESGPRAVLGWSVLSSDTANFGRNFDYPTALSAEGADIDLQVYGATHPTYTVSAGLGMLRNTQVPQTRTTMTFDITPEGDGPFNDYRTWPGPRRLWIGEWSRPSTFAALAR